MLVLSVCMASLLLVQYPFVQTRLATRATEWLSQALGLRVEVGGVAINFFNRVTLKDVHLYDSKEVRMIEVPRLELLYQIRQLVQNGHLFVDKAILESPTVRMVMRDTLNMDELLYAIDRIGNTDTLTAAADTTPSSRIHIANILLRNGMFIYDDPASPLPPVGEFDNNHLAIQDIYGYFSRFRIADDTVEMQVHRLKAAEPRSELQMRRLDTFFRYCRKSMSFTQLHAEVNNSLLKDSLVLLYDTPAALANFYRQVRLEARLDSSVLVMADLAHFSPSLAGITDTLVLSARIRGPVANFRARELDLRFGKNSRLAGTMAFNGLPVVSETFMDFRLQNSRTNEADLQPYIGEHNAAWLKEFGNVRFNANFTGFSNDFAMNGQFNTQMGDIFTDLNIKTETEQYRGLVRTRNFQLGKFIEEPEYVKKVDMEGSIAGSGFSLDEADFILSANIRKIGLMDYEYQRVRIDSAHMRKKVFEGRLSVQDPNLALNLNGNINFQDSTFHFSARIDSAYLHRLNLTDQHIFLHTQIAANFSGLEPDRIRGQIRLTENQVGLDSLTVPLADVLLKTEKSFSPTLRTIELKSPHADFIAQGNFSFVQVVTDLRMLAKEYFLSVSNRQEEISAYYSAKKKAAQKTGTNGRKQAAPPPAAPPSYYVNYKANIFNIRNLLRLFGKEESLYFSADTRLSGSINSGEDIALRFNFSADSLRFNNLSFYGNDVALFAAKLPDSVLFDTEVILTSGRQELGGISTQGLSVEGYQLEKNLIIDAYISQPETGDFIDLNGYLTFLPEGYEVRFPRTTFRFMQQDWLTSDRDRNAILILPNEIVFDDVGFSQDIQRIALDGIISSDTSQALLVDISNFNMKALSTYFKREVGGNLTIQLTAKDILETKNLKGDAVLSEFYLDGYPIGTLAARTQWIDNTRQLMLDAALTREQVKVLTVSGYYNPNEEDRQQINLDIIFDGADLKSAEPFLKENISDLQGTIIGYLNVKGSLDKVDLKGDALIRNGQFRMNYLGVLYHFDDKVYFQDNRIFLRNFRLLDPFENVCLLNGGLTHQGLRNFQIDLNAQLTRFMAMEIPEQGNDAFYGTAVGTGRLNIKGTFDEVDLVVNARTDRNTRIYIPIYSEATVEEQTFIRYINFTDTTSAASSSAATAPQEGVKLNMELNLDITEEAYCEIIIDKRAGDIIRGNGRGKLQMRFDPAGDFTMNGDVEIVRGNYNFTMLNIVNKEFGILPNSHITWSGDPYRAVLDVTATYTQPASLAPIIQADSSILNQPEIRRKYPVQVQLKLQGDLLQPKIGFDIQVTDFPRTILAAGVPVSLDGFVQAFRQRIQNDESELNRQVFSLIILKRLSPEQTFSGISSSAGGSVSELLANQLSYWLSQVDSNLEIDFDINGLNSEALNTFQLRLSYSFMQGRLRITRDGAFTNASNNTSVASVIGDWTIEYMINPDGSLRMKMYHKQNLNAFNTGLENNSVAGASLMHTRSFNSFKELLRGKKRRKEPVPEQSRPSFPQTDAMIERKEETEL